MDPLRHPVEIECCECKAKTLSIEASDWVLIRKRATWDDSLWFCPECRRKGACLARLDQIRRQDEPTDLGRWCKHKGN